MNLTAGPAARRPGPGPPAAGPVAVCRHQHERDRHGDCQAGAEWRDRPGRYKPDSDCQCSRLRVTPGRAAGARPGTGTGWPGAGCWARASCLAMIIQVQVVYEFTYHEKQYFNDN
jgi:hypothetical protein